MKKYYRSATRILTLVLVMSLLVSSLCLTVAAVKITYEGQVVDTFNGVPAKYKLGDCDADYDYSCAAYVRNYYSHIFGVTVSNLLKDQTPIATHKDGGYSFRQISSDIRPGDVVRQTFSSNGRSWGHWAIVKAVNGNTLTLIEQNWKNDATENATVNRTINVSEGVVFTLYKGNTRVNNGGGNASIQYWVHVQDYGTLGTVSDGAVAGTTGQSRRMEDLGISLSGVSGGLSYRAHVSQVGWKPWVSAGGCGTQGQSLRMEAVQIKLTGEAANRYSVQYRVHVEGYGWLDWVKDGAVAGTTGQGRRIEAIQIQLVPK